ncbi:MAG: hypothetical protein ACRD4A_02030 [Candidatus Acidiferrales bacterium]
MSSVTKKEFVARTKYHHSQRTSEHVTLLAYKDLNEAYELLDDREPDLEFLAGSKDYILEEWGKRNRQLTKNGFQRDSLAGDPEWQQFI